MSVSQSVNQSVLDSPLSLSVDHLVYVYVYVLYIWGENRPQAARYKNQNQNQKHHSLSDRPEDQESGTMKEVKDTDKDTDTDADNRQTLRSLDTAHETHSMGSPTTEDLPKLRRKTSEQLLRDETLTAAEREDIIKQHLPPAPQPGVADDDTGEEDICEDGVVAPHDASHVHAHTPRPRSKSSASAASSSAVSSSSKSAHHQKQAQKLSFWAWLASAIKAKIHYMAYIAISLVVGFWIRGRHAYRAIIERILAILYHHHRTPELIQRDVKGLSQLPSHLSCVLKNKWEEEDSEFEGVGQLGDDVAELVAWTSCAGIPMLSIYERTGMCRMF